MAYLYLSLYASVLLCLWAVASGLYRLFFHPLANFPGPKLAALTFVYEWYYDLVLGGQFTFKLKDLRKIYGPVVRINPDELHFKDPDYYDEIFNVTNGRVHKTEKVANGFGPYPATIGTADHDLHRVRRAAVNVFFSKRSVDELLPHLQPLINSLIDRFEDASKTGEVINLKYCYSALTTDIMNEYCFSRDSHYVSKPDFGRKTFDDIDSFLFVSLINVHIPWAMNSLYRLPDRVMKIINPAMSDVLDMRKMLGDQVEAIRQEKDLAHLDSGHRTIFHDLLQSSLPLGEKSQSRLRDEAFSLVTAGSLTSSFMMMKMSYFIAAHPHVQRKLLLELKQAIPQLSDLVDLRVLEGLPYLNAVIRESLRLGHPVTHRISRTFPDKTLRYGSFDIPRGTNVNMTALLIHENEDIFPDPTLFRPERWLNNDGLNRYLIPFSKGPRSCLGINLAWAEMYIVVATVFRRFNFDVTGVIKERDIDVKKDIILPVPRDDSPGVLVKILQNTE